MITDCLAKTDSNQLFDTQIAVCISVKCLPNKTWAKCCCNYFPDKAGWDQDLCKGLFQQFGFGTAIVFRMCSITLVMASAQLEPVHLLDRTGLNS